VVRLGVGRPFCAMPAAGAAAPAAAAVGVAAEGEGLLRGAAEIVGNAAGDLDVHLPLRGPLKGDAGAATEDFAAGDGVGEGQRAVVGVIDGG